MRRTLTALTVAASLTASGTSAFEINTSVTVLNDLAGTPTIGDLSAGVKALVRPWSGCIEGGRLYFESATELQTDPFDYFQYYEITKQPDGEFTVTYSPTQKGSKELPPMAGFFHDCSETILLYPETTLYPVKSINGFTDLRSFWVDLVNQGYE
jgi:hypothetical protein